MNIRTILPSALIVVLSAGFAMAATSAHGEDILLCPIADDWEAGSEGCPCEPGWQPTEEELNRILRFHQVWMDVRGWQDPSAPGRAVLCAAEFLRADLSGADLSRADLSGANLFEANLSGANLFEADLRDADLQRADLSGTSLWGGRLSGADLKRANLSGADLFEANLSGANLSGANLSGAHLWYANLSGADLRRVNLSEAVVDNAVLRNAYLSEANLSATGLFEADLSSVILTKANLIGANLLGANLSDANLWRADLSGARLIGVDLSGATLTQATLSNTDLGDADLSEARIRETNFDGARFTRVDLSDSTYEPTSAPARGFLTEIEGLTTVSFGPGRESGLILLRKALQEAGLRPLEREATYAIERWRTHYMITQPQQLGQRIGGLLRLIFFEWTTGYGLHSSRALMVLLTVMAIMTIVYAIPIWMRPAHPGPSLKECEDVPRGIYRVWPGTRIILDHAGFSEAGKTKIDPLQASGLSAFAHGFFFSILSAFHIGWRDFNVGSWISRLQRREYTLRARGWVRIVSGIQSLLSVYLLAIWVLTYFGRPFQ